MIKQNIQKAVSKATVRPEGDINIEKPKNNQADYAFGVFAMAKEVDKNPQEVAVALSSQLSNEGLSGIEKVEASGGYVNFFLADDYLQRELLEISKQENYGQNEALKGKTIMVEYTDPNPFKLFHIGHLMSNTIGESIARLYSASGAKVLRVNYQGDVGMHVAKAVAAMMPSRPASKSLPKESDSLEEKINYLGQAYAAGSAVYEEDEGEIKKEIEEINQKIYDKSDPEVNKIYDLGKKWSLEYFEEEYKRLGTKFDEKFFESEVFNDGLEIVKANPNIFKESEGAMVFKGEDYGLHTRVFINSKGLPTYEAKELGLNKKKFEMFHPDLSVIVTGNEVDEYFRVLLKVMELTMADVASKTKHIGHGMMRLPTGKMSSRTGDVVTADSFIDQTKEKLKSRRQSVGTPTEASEDNQETEDATREAVAIGAIKYSILKQSPGKDIIFDFDKSLAVKGDSGPYLQYTYARLKAILVKSKEHGTGSNEQGHDAHCSLLIEPSELTLIKHFLEFPVAIHESTDMIAPQRLALYLFELANLANNFYEKVHILEDEDSGRMSARLLLVRTTAEILSRGLDILGIKTPERI